MMNCEEFEKAVLAEPGAESEARSRHAAGCPDCARLMVKVTAMERQLSAVMAVPVPQSLQGGMPDIEALSEARAGGSDNVVAFPGDRVRGGARGRWPAFASLAAALALVAMFVLRPTEVGPAADEALVGQIFDHIDHELGYMQAGGAAVPAERLQAALGPAGVALPSGGGQSLVSYAKNCIIGGENVPHLVVQGANGPVTVLILPHRSVKRPIAMARDGLEGVLLPVGDEGSIAIIGRDAASVDAVRDLAANGLGFTTT